MYNTQQDFRVPRLDQSAEFLIALREQPMKRANRKFAVSLRLLLNLDNDFDAKLPLPTYCYDFCFFFIYREATDEDTCAPSSNELSDSFCCNISCYMDILRIVGLLGHHIGNS